MEQTPLNAQCKQDGEWICREVVVQNQLGVHARPTGLIVRSAIQFAAEIFLDMQESITVDGKVVAASQDSWCTQADAKSVMDVAVLNMAAGTRVRIRAQGTDAREAVDELAELFDSKFGED